MKGLLVLFLAVTANAAEAQDIASVLPPVDAVSRVLLAHPNVQAASSQIRMEEANRTRLEAGSYEWNLRLGSQQRRAGANSGGADERFSEWNAALERPLRLPGKSLVDGELGASGVALAETAHRDALHEAARNLLKAWFVWLKESATVRQWNAQVTLLQRQASGLKRRHALGDAARLETVQAEAALAQAEAQLAQAQIRQRTAAEELRRRYPDLPIAEPTQLAEPSPVGGSEADWVEVLLEHNHELAIARQETQRALLASSRMRQDRLPDPSVGIQFSRERGGQENVIGAYISIPIPGSARRASADAAVAQLETTGRREMGVARKVSSEAANLFHTTTAGFTIWQAARNASDRLVGTAEMTARAYQLGEGTLNDLLLARRQANEAQLATALSQLEALELHSRLLLDAHRLWNLE